ncbi:M24 family metallopeptidase [Thermodesulfobacteriota bacterium]
MSDYYPYNYEGHPVKQKYPETWPMPSEEVRDMRWKALRKSMERNNLDFLIITPSKGYMPTLSNQLCYISNFVPFANSGLFIIFPLNGDPQMAVTTELGPQFYHIVLETSWIEDVSMSSNPVKDMTGIIKQMKLDKGRGGIVGYKNGVFSAVAYEGLCEALPGVHFEDATPVFGRAQNEVSRSSEEELKYLRKACEILDLAYEAIANALKPGVTEPELWAEAEHAIIKNGGWYGHFMIGAVGPSPVFLRGPATFKTLRQGDVVIFEIDTIYAGIMPQACFALSIGRPREDVEKMFKFCEELYPYTLEQLNKKRTFMDIDVDLNDRIHAKGYEPITPHIHLYNLSYAMPMQSPPQPGDFFTVHPNCCNSEYSAGAKFGDAVRINKDGKVERLNKVPAKLNIV